MKPTSTIPAATPDAGAPTPETAGPPVTAGPTPKIAAPLPESPGLPSDAGTFEPASEQPPIVLGPHPGPILAGDTMAAAGRKAMWVQLDRLLARSAGLADTERPDDLRKYRVATRRLRAALRAFGPAYSGRDTKPLRRDLGELADAVGAVRDFDHRIADLERWAAERGEGGPAGVAPLAATWATERERRLRDLLRRVATRRHRRLMAALAAFVEAPATGDTANPDAGPQLIRDRLASRLWSGYEEVRAFAGVLRWADLETLHRLRLSVKRLRDTLEFMGDLVGPRRALLAEKLVALQDHLGTLNDASIGAAAVREFLETRYGTLTPDEQAEIAAYLADRERDVSRLRRSVGRPWRPVAGITFARRLGRLVVMSPAAPVAGRPRPASR